MAGRDSQRRHSGPKGGLGQKTHAGRTHGHVAQRVNVDLSRGSHPREPQPRAMWAGESPIWV